MLVLKLNAPPFSINKAHYRNGNRTNACRKWGDAILEQLEAYEEEINEFRSQYEPLICTHSLKVELIFEQPRSLMFKTSKPDRGKLSRRGSDLSNIEKMLIDLIFDPRFFKRGACNLNLDDTLISTLISKKRQSPNNKSYTWVKISMEENKDL